MRDRIVDGLVIADSKVATAFNDPHVDHLIGYLLTFFIRASGAIRGEPFCGCGSAAPGSLHSLWLNRILGLRQAC